MNSTTGALSAASTQTAGVLPDAVAVTPDGKYAYIPSGSGGTLYGYALAGLPNLTSLPGGPETVTGAADIAGVAIDPTGTFVYVGGNTT